MKRNRNRMLQQKTRVVLQKWLIPFIAVSIFSAVIISSFDFLKKMDCFKVKEIYARYGNELLVMDREEFCYLKGKNIFNIDLDREAANIRRFYPSYKKIRLTRFLPDKIFIDLLQRKPLAAIKAGRHFFIDDNFVVFEPAQGQESLDVPLIRGLDKKLNGVNYGQRLNHPELMLAVDIIKKVKANNRLKDYPIASVELAKPGDVSLFMLVQKGLLDYTNVKSKAGFSVIEVRLGQEDITKKVSLLASLLRQVRNNLAGIKYIDLRFNEPVIKMKKPQSS